MSADTQVTPQQKRDALERILASRHFQRSERLSSFLRHICEQNLAGRSSEINERDIGCAVFQLPKDFDPTIDGIVRSHASRLRRKLELYYLREGADETIRVIIPRGGYHPRFVEYQTAEPVITETPIVLSELPPPPAPPHPIQSQSPPPRRRLLAAIAACIVIACVATVAAAALWKHTHAAPSVWSTVLAADSQTIIVPGDSNLVMWEQMQHRNVSLSEYITGNFARTTYATPAEKTVAEMIVSRRYTSVLDLDIVHSISAIAWGLHQSPRLRFARDIRPNDLKDRNIILIGSSETNPWVQMFEGSMNFVLVKDQGDTAHMVNQGDTTYIVKNKHPQPGEPGSWRSDPTTQTHIAFCKVTFAANGSEAGNVLILEGTSSAGTECAWEFLSDTAQMEHLRRLGNAPVGSLPHFEVLLRTSNLAGDAAANTIIASRILP